MEYDSLDKVKNNLMIKDKLGISNDNNQNQNNIELALFDIKENLEYLYSLNCHKIN